jgi:hypothetical protein
MSPRNSILIASLLLLCCSSAVVAQGRLDHLKSWVGKYPTERKGRLTTSFFAEPDIRGPLARLLNRADLNLLTKEYGVEAPIKQFGDYLAVKVCRQHNCDEEQAALAINLRTGDVYVRMKDGDKVRWFASKGTAKDLPADVREYLDDFAV